MSLEVVELFGVATIQGERTPGLRTFGVPPGGAFDTYSFAMANALLGNERGAPCLELAMASIVVRALEFTCFAWVGAGAIQGTVPLNSGDEFKFVFPSTGCRSYLAMRGGMVGDGPVKKGSVLSGGRPAGALIKRLAEAPQSLRPQPLRVVAGPQATMLPLDLFLGRKFTVAQRLDRMGIRLEPDEAFRHGIELPSEPATVGAIQVTPDGTPILLGPDGPTIGGYPKIGVVIRADVPLMGQLRPGDEVQFKEITLEEARRINREATETLGRKELLARDS